MAKLQVEMIYLLGRPTRYRANEFAYGNLRYHDYGQ